MRFLIVSLLSLVLVVPGLATVDPDPNQMGVYFDSNADVTCIDVPANYPFWAHVVITNPSSAEIWSVEFSLCVETIGGGEDMLFKLSEQWSFGYVIGPPESDMCTDGIYQGGGDPLLPQGVNAVVASFLYMQLVEMGINFYLGAVPIQAIEDGLPAYVGTGDAVIPLGVSSGDPGLPVASVNGCSAVRVEGSTFGGLKCLFR